MREVEIRAEEPADVAQVFEVEREAFGDRLQADLVDSLRRSARPQLSLVAVLGPEVVGHIFFSPVTFEPGPGPPAAQLSPVAVAPSHQRRGIGSGLIRAGLARCRSTDWEAVFLVGNPLFYARFGFRMARPYNLSCGGPHDPFLQVVELRPAALSGVRGQVAFHPAFAEFEAG